MRLTQAQRDDLFKGIPTKIAFDGSKPCPVKVGHIEVLSAHVKLEVTGIRRAKTGEHVLVYTLYNNRLGQRFLAAQQGQTHPDNYAHSGGSAVDPEAGEAVDHFTQKRFTREARGRTRQESANLIVAAEEVMAAVSERAEASPEFRREARLTMHRIRRELDRFIERQRRKAA